MIAYEKIICKVEYDTADGKYFLHVNGGENSPYTEENIKRMSAAKAEERLGK